MKVIFDYFMFMNQKYGGVSRYFTELYKEYTRLDDVEIDIPIKYAMNEYLRYIDIEHTQIEETTKKNSLLMKMYAYLNQRHISKYLDNHECDIIHPTWYSPYIFEVGKKQKIVCTVHDMIQELFWKDIDKRTIERKRQAIVESDAVIADSYSTKIDILNIYPDVSEEKITVVHLGANSLRTSSAKVDYDLPERYVLYVGKRADYKNGMFVIEALKELILRENLHILYVGGGKFDEKEQKFINEHKVEKYVHQVEASDIELAYIYNHAECFIFPTKYEGFGFPILEAFENDCPVVCTNSSSLPEVAGAAALFYEVDDYDGCASAVLTILNDAEKRNTLIKKGKERVKEFSWNKTARETLDVYNYVMNK